MKLLRLVLSRLFAVLIMLFYISKRHFLRKEKLSYVT